VPIVTLTTDFGTRDGYVGAMKGVLLARAPGVTVVDIAHDIPRHDVVAAAYALANAVPYFPAGTVHVAVVDPGVGGARKGVILVGEDHFFVGPDNGIFTLVSPEPRASFEIAQPMFRRTPAAATFHGRDMFAVAAARLATGGRAEEAGPPTVLVGAMPLGVVAGDGDIAGAGCVVHVDVFGNLITAIRASELGEGARFRVAGREIDRLSETYESVACGEMLAYIGSAGTLEIAVREGNAALVLGARRGTRVELLPARVREGS
jgi:S-adenosylmethionine hydrolase